MKLKTNRKEGFTIIEVVLVLAIAGMIFLVVFLAVPQLQQSRRDTQRRNDIGRVLTKFEDRAANNNGNYPRNQTELDTFVADYISTGNFQSPSGANYQFVYDRSGSSTSPQAPRIAGSNEWLVYGRQAVCNGENFQNDGSTRAFALRGQLEGGGFFCVDNQ